MSDEQITIDGPLAHAARALCQISAKDVAHAANLGKSELKAYEKGTTDFTHYQEDRLVIALEEFGARFIHEGGEGGYGVRLKFNRSKVRAVQRWENEGGSSAEDDV